MLLENQTALIYGAAGAVGGAIAHAFAQDGASVYLAGRTRATLERVASSIGAHGGKAQVAPVDASDAAAVDAQIERIVQQAGRLDISCNVVGIDDVQGRALTAIEPALFLQPVSVAMRTHLLTTTAAARRMSPRGSGVILTVTAQAGRRPYPNTGGFGVACAALEALYRQLAAELGPSGVRVGCVRSAGSPDAAGVDAVFRQHAASAGISREAFEASIAQRTLLGRLPRLADVAAAATLFASDRARAMTAAILNVTCGELAD
jgi:3-oxoacyl-[acyl-carrier protein] reductase